MTSMFTPSQNRLNGFIQKLAWTFEYEVKQILIWSSGVIPGD